MKIISRPVVIESLEWSWSRGWSCSWRKAIPEAEHPEGGIIVRPWSLLSVLRRVDWWTEPLSASAGETGDPR